MDIWRETFGDPEEFERQFFAQRALNGVGESETARRTRETQEFVRKNLFRSVA
jgi:hypothetical protein